MEKEILASSGLMMSPVVRNQSVIVPISGAWATTWIASISTTSSSEAPRHPNEIIETVINNIKSMKIDA